MQKLVIYSYFWENYSISLQKSPLSKILPDMISYNNRPMSRPVHDPLRPHDPLPKIWGSRPPTPRIDAPEDVNENDS